MNLTEALRINNAARSSPTRLAVFLATGFTPLSLPIFLSAHLSSRMTGCRIDVAIGSFGDLPGNIERMGRSHAELAAVCVEWEDLDPRLGVRRLATTTWKDFPEIVASAANAKNRLVALIREAASHCRVAVSLPHLPLPPLSHTPAHRMSGFEAKLRLVVAEMQAELAAAKGVCLLRPGTSPGSDFSATLHSGFPYTVEHASELAGSLAAALVDTPPKKGIIIDLDDTLWKGILGEDGTDGVHWDLENKAQHHGLFQRFLHALAAEGTLVAIASKNSPELVAEIFATRADLLLKAESVFPMEVHWQPKSESVARILDAWNVSADSVVFVDDSPMELAEVEAAHPGISCRRFPAQDLVQFEILLRELRETFAREKVGEEDTLRAESLRTRARLSSEATTANPETLLQGLEAELTFALGTDASDERALDLVNKTNQFNLNGARIAEPFWRQGLARPGAFLLTCTYKDKFGALGKIAVLAGVVNPEHIRVEHWVMSCRAFARRIEFACLRHLFENFAVDRIVLDYRRTERNRPLQELLESLGLDQSHGGEITLSKEQFLARAPKVYHRVIVNSKKPEVATYV